MCKLLSVRTFFQVGLLLILFFFSECGVIGQQFNRPQNLAETLIRKDSILVALDQLKSLLPKAEEGTVFLVKNGVYKDVILDLTKNNDKAVIIKPQSPSGVTFTGRSSIRILNTERLVLTGFQFKDTRVRNTLVLNNCRKVEVTNNYFEKCGNNEYGNIVRIENQSSFNNIYLNTFDANESMGVVVIAKEEDATHCVNNFIHHNRFMRIPQVGKVYSGKTNGLEAIQLGQGVASAKLKLYTHIYDNVFEDIVGDGLEIISVKSSNNYIYENTFLNNRSGITLRFGDNSKIYNNYLENTTQGIRVHGFGHVIKNNYISDARVGIQLPASQFSTNERATSASGYYQQENLKITNNIIVNPGSAAFVIGNGKSASAKRTLMPRDVSITSNEIVISNSEAKEYQVDSEDDMSRLRIRGNRRLSDTTSINSSSQLRQVRSRQSIRGNSRTRTGTTWR